MYVDTYDKVTSQRWNGLASMYQIAIEITAFAVSV